VYGLVIFTSGIAGFAQLGLDSLSWKEDGVDVVNWWFTGAIAFVGVLWAGVSLWRAQYIVERDLESVEGERGEREALLIDSMAENQYGSTDNP